MHSPKWSFYFIRIFNTWTTSTQVYYPCTFGLFALWTPPQKIIRRHNYLSSNKCNHLFFYWLKLIWICHIINNFSKNISIHFNLRTTFVWSMLTFWYERLSKDHPFWIVVGMQRSDLYVLISIHSLFNQSFQFHKYDQKRATTILFI